MSRKNLTRILLNTLLGMLLVLLWAHFVDLNQIRVTLGHTNLIYFVPFLILFNLSNLLRVLRIKLFLKKLKLPFSGLYYLQFLNQLLNFTIPIRAGEVARAVYISGEGGVPFSQGVLWVFLDRFMDFWVTIFTLTLLFLVVPVGIPDKVRLTLAVILVGFTLATVLILVSQSLVKKMVKLVPIKPLQSFATNIIEGFDIFRRNPLELLVLLLLSVLAAFSDSLQLWVVLYFLGVNLGFLKNFIANLLFALTFVIPAAPGYVGTIEASILAVLTGIFKVDPNLSSSAAVLIHVTNIVIVLGLGLLGLYMLKFNLDLVWRRLRRDK